MSVDKHLFSNPVTGRHIKLQENVDLYPQKYYLFLEMNYLHVYFYLNI